MKSIYLGAGCFWCTEFIFARLRGVISASSGYANGDNLPVDYERVCTGESGYAEVIKVDYDESIIGLDIILNVFFSAHDSTQLNRQGNDIGTQYRSSIYCIDNYQLEFARNFIKNLDDFTNIVTEVDFLKCFYPAEDYHQDFFMKNPANPYCNAVALPKMVKCLDLYRAYFK